jgi:archaemetzincin
VTHPIHILNASALDDAALNPIAREVGEVFRCPVDIRRLALDCSGAYDESRRQVNSSIMLARILEARPDNSSKIIAVVGVDLYVPVLTFVFGEAQFKGTAAIVSIERLRNPFYGLPDDGPLMRRRLAKEIVHELGHTYGLYHCRQFECVMRSSTYVEEIDLKKAEPCSQCRLLLSAA